MQTTTRIPIIRKTIIDNLEADLKQLGFEVKNRNKENQFIRKTSRGNTEIMFFYYDYYPLHYEVKFTFFDYQFEINHVINSFFNSISKRNYDTANIVMTEGDFYEELRSKLPKYRSGFKNKIVTEADLSDLVIKYRDLIFNTIIPLSQKLSSLSGTHDFLLEIKELIVENLSVKMIATSMIVSKILNDNSYPEIFNFYKSRIPKRSEKFGQLAQESLEIIQMLDRFLQKSENYIRDPFSP